MPELPDLVYVCARLNQELSGDRITSVVVKEPVLVRNLAREDGRGSFEESLAGQAIERVFQHGPFVVFDMANPLRMVIHPMLAGAFVMGTKPAGLLQFQCERSFWSYRDDKKMGKVYLIAAGQEERIPRFVEQGVDLLSDDFTEKRFLELLSESRRQVRAFLMEQEKLSALGNAYSDEILFDAGIHPKTMCPALTEEQRRRLFASIGRVIGSSIALIIAQAPPLHQKYRDHMKVRNRKDQPCPRCAARIRRESVLGYDTFFCPVCQPATRKHFIDWRPPA